MSEEVVIRHCSPTLAGCKTGSIFSCEYESKTQLFRDLRTFNRVLVPKGMRVLPLKCADGRALIYLFRPAVLARDLTEPQVAGLLQELGYHSAAPDLCIMELIGKLNSRDTFPHEIGLFLGYPPEDVLGFICHRGSHYKCVGCWKVYGNEQEARRRFRQYKKCTEVYFRQWRKGVALDRLAVAI